MNMIYDEEKRIFRIDTENSSYAIAIVDDEGFLGHVYYGKRISDTDIDYCMRLGDYPFTPSVMDRERGSFYDIMRSEFSSNGIGDFRESCIEVEDAHGHSAVDLRYRSHRIFGGKPELEGLPSTFGNDNNTTTLEIEAYDSFLKLSVLLRYSIFENSDAIARSVIVRNQSDKPIKLTKIMSCCVDMDDDNYDMLTLCGAWGRERHIERRPVCHGKQSIGSSRGKSSHQENPFIALLSHNADQQSGDVYGFNFVYSGNFLAQIEKDQFDSLRVVVGINPKDFSFTLEPGDSFTAPEVVIVYSHFGLGRMTRTYHDLYREHLINPRWAKISRPILINNWEATYFKFDEDKLYSIAKTAHECGIEMLVIDDGWFGKRDSDDSGLGDWVVNESKLRGGLCKLAERINSMGMKLGLWFEPEMVSKDSDLFRAHPDWIIHIDGRVPVMTRHQYVLDLSRREVVEYVYESVARILRSANIEYVKWDMNRLLTDLGSAALSTDRQGELSHRFTLAVYELQGRLLREFPDLLIENCSSGGARYDPGMLYYSPQIWCSDNADAIDRLAIHEGTALVYPLSTMGAHVSDCPNHTNGRVTPFETRGHVALTGTFGYELDVTKISQADRDMISEQVSMFKKYNSLMLTGDYYRVASYHDNHSYDFYGVVSKDKREALFTYVQVEARANRRARMLKIPGLSPDCRYTIENTGNTYFGDTLANIGVHMSDMSGSFRSKLIHLVICEQ